MPGLCTPCALCACRRTVHATSALKAVTQLTRRQEGSPPHGSRLFPPRVHSDSRPGRTDGPQPRRRHERFAKAAATTTRKPRPCNVKARTPAHCTGVLQARRASRLSALSTGYSPAPLQHGSVGCRARVERPVGSVGRVGKMRPARCSASPSQRPARPRAPWDHLLHLPWGRVAAVRDRERPPNALAAVASCLALQLVDTSPSPTTRA